MAYDVIPYETTVDGLTFNAILFREAGFWVAQALERDICTQATTREGVEHGLDLHIEATMAVADELSADFHDIPPAPARFWEMHRQAMLNQDLPSPSTPAK